MEVDDSGIVQDDVKGKLARTGRAFEAWFKQKLAFASTYLHVDTSPVGDVE